MLSVAGIIRIIEEPLERPVEGGGIFLNFLAEGKDPKRKGGRFYYRIGLYVPSGKLEAAREDVKKGASLCIRHGDLDGMRSQKDANFVYNQVKTAWWDVEPLVMTMRGELQ